MPKPKLPRPHEEAGTGAESVPPGATPKGQDRTHNPRGRGPNEDAVPERTIDDPQGGEQGHRSGG